MRFFLLSAIALSAPGAHAETWIPVGPAGGDVRSLASDPRDPRVVYLGTASSLLYRSDDGGRRWQRAHPGFPLAGMSLDDLIVAPNGDLIVGYWQVSGKGGGVARSSDGGRTFAVLPGIAGQAVRGLALAASDPDLLVAGTPSGVFRSEDGGQSWRRISPEGDPEIRNVGSIAIDPTSPEVVYVGTWHLPWRTRNGGRTWERAFAGMIADSDVMTLTVDHRDPRTVYATACSGIYRSPDAAARWSKVRGIPASSRRTRAFAQDPAHPEYLLAGTTEGLWISEDDTGSWRLATGSDLVVNAVLILPGGTILLGSDGAGVLRSEDAGLTWARSNRGFSERFVSRVVFDPSGQRLLAGVFGDRHHGGVFEGTPNAGGWTRLADGLEGREVLALARSAEGPLAGTDDGLFRLDVGRWTRIPTVVGGRDVNPRVTEIASLGSRVVLAATASGLLRSTDGGATWERRLVGSAALTVALAASTTDPSLALAATPLGLYRTRDAGATWEPVSVGPDDVRIRSLTLLPGNDRVLFATTPTGLFKSTDQGRSWYRRGGGLPCSDISALAMSPDGRTLYASDFSQGGLFTSMDGGDTWVPFPTHGLPSSRVWAVAVDPTSPGRLLAAMATGGLHAWVPAAPAAGAQASQP